MGVGMASNLLRKGFRVRGFDVRAEPAARLEAEGGIFAASPGDAAEGAKLAVVVVLTTQQVEEVLFGADGIVPRLSPGATILVCSTVPPAAVSAFEKRCLEAGHHILDCPVTGGVDGAEAGTLKALASGTDVAFAAATPLLEAMTAKIFKFGDRAGAGSTAKAVNQLLVGVHLAVTAEAVELLKHLDVDARKVLEIVGDGVAASYMFNNRAELMLAGKFSLKDATGVFIKDLATVEETGKAAGLPMHLATTARAAYLKAAEETR
jgi:3-hydroxyisobutyrate dehydrogenase-like beta-hydroxyacid dehydrogenase